MDDLAFLSAKSTDIPGYVYPPLESVDVERLFSSNKLALGEKKTLHQDSADDACLLLFSHLLLITPS